MTIKDEDGFQGLAEIEQTIRTWTGSSTRFSGMVARPAKNPGKTIALLTKIGRQVKLVEDVTGEEVSEMHAR